MIKKYFSRKTLYFLLATILMIAINFSFIMRLSGLSYSPYTWQNYVGGYLAELTVNTSGNGTVTSLPAGISCPNDCSEFYDLNTAVTLTANSDLGSTFTGWSGDCSGTGDCVIIMTEDKNVTATFALNQHALTATTSGNGSITSSPAGINCPSDCTEFYDYNTEVTLTATANSGSTFTGWGGACTGNGNCITAMTENKNVIATFTLDTHETYTPIIFNNHCAGFTGPREGEVNDSTASANGPLCFGREYKGSPDDNPNSPADQDSDYYYIDVNQPSTIQIRVSDFLPANAQVQLYYLTVGQLVAIDAADGDGDYAIDYPGTAGVGRYFIRVVAGAGHTVGNGDYSLSVTIASQ